jgi:hypothetical protein
VELGLGLGLAHLRGSPVKLGVAGKEFFCGMLSGAAVTRRRWRRRGGVMLQLILAPLSLHSGDRGELGSFCTGVSGQRFVISVR